MGVGAIAPLMTMVTKIMMITPLASLRILPNKAFIVSFLFQRTHTLGRPFRLVPTIKNPSRLPWPISHKLERTSSATSSERSAKLERNVVTTETLARSRIQWIPLSIVFHVHLQPWTSADSITMARWHASKKEPSPFLWRWR